MVPRGCVLKFHALCMIVTASQRLAFGTGFYTSASVRNTVFRGIEGAWLEGRKRRERPIDGWGVLAENRAVEQKARPAT